VHSYCAQVLGVWLIDDSRRVPQGAKRSPVSCAWMGSEYNMEAAASVHTAALHSRPCCPQEGTLPTLARHLKSRA
jgi:hypothetical protein